ncbi:MAG: HAD family phosphatase [Actinomycetia bacterium]|nr:HAD family phosphatase [Actinomycetes bacterium]
MQFPAAVVFDLDGTLIESENVWDEVRRGLAAKAGLPWPEVSTQAMMGMSTQEWGTHLVEVVGLSGTWQDAATATIDGMVDSYRHGLPALPGAAEAVRRVAAELPVGIASSSPRRLIDLVCQELGVAELLRASVSTEEVGRGKPWPDGYLRAAELIGVPADQCVAVEDSSAGVRSALAAQMAVVVVPPAFHPPTQDLLDQCDAVISSLDELTLDLLRSLR